MYRAVLFDVEDTLVDVASGLEYAVDAVLSEMGYTRKRELKELMVQKALDMVGSARTLYELRVLLSLRGVLGGTVNTLVFSGKMLVWLDYLRSQWASPMPHSREVLSTLSSGGVALGAVTDMSRGAYFRLRRRIGFLGDSFNVVVTRSDLRRTKPSPEGILLALAKLGFTPQEAAYVGNMPSDVAAGSAAGVTTIMMPGKLKPYLVGYNQIRPNYVINDLREVAAIVLGSELR